MKKYLLAFLLLVGTCIHGQAWTKLYDYVDDCICGLAKVNKDGKIGYVDQKGVLIVPLIYDEGMAFNEGYVTVRLDKKWGFLDSTGKVIIEPEYEETTSFYEGFASVRKGGKFGFINIKNDIF